MGTQTTGNLSLTKPNNGEYIDGWDEPFNENADRIDTGASYAVRSVKNAAGNFTDTVQLNVPSKVIGTADALKKRMDKVSDADGNPIPSKGVLFANDDRLIGSQQALFDVIAKLERYMFWMAQGSVDSGVNIPDRLRNELARRGYHERNCILGNSTVSVVVHGAVNNIPALSPVAGVPFDVDIEGKIYNVRKDLFAETSLDLYARGVALLYLEPATTALSDAGSQLVYSGADGQFVQSPAVSGPWRVFSSASNPSLVNARAGDIIRISSKAVDIYDIAGDYIIESTPAAGTATILGGLPVTVDGTITEVKNCTFQIIHPWACKLGYQFLASAGGQYSDINLSVVNPDNKAFIGEVWWDGAAVVDTFSYAPYGLYDSGWVAAPAGPPTAVAHVGSMLPLDHKVGIMVPAWQPTANRSFYPRARIFSARVDADGNVFDIQELPFNPHFGGTATGSNGWLGYCNRRYLEFQYGCQLYGDTDPTYAWGYQRKVDMATFPNDPLQDASYEFTPANCVYRAIVSRS